MKKNIDDVIGMAWSDKISWRKRVRGRLSKHRKKSKVKLSNYEF